MGMSTQEFWEGVPYLKVAYREKRKIENDRLDAILWAMGCYVRTAVVSAFNDDCKYPDEPNRIFGEPLSEEEEEMLEQDKAKASLRSFAASWGGAFEECAAVVSEG